MREKLHTSALATILDISMEVGRKYGDGTQSGGIIKNAAVLDQAALEHDELVAGGHTGPRHPIGSLELMFSTCLPALLETLGEVVEQHSDEIASDYPITVNVPVGSQTT